MVADEALVDGPGSGLPRGGLTGERSRLAVAALVLGLVSPVAVAVAAVVMVRLMGQVRRGWREVVAVAGPLSLAIVVIVVMVGVPSLFGWLAEMALLGVPLGVAAGAGGVGLLERWAGRADWHPVEQRRQAVEVTRKHHRADQLSEPGAVAEQPVPVLGVWLGGDLEPWRRENYVVPPPPKAPGALVIGGSGSGKTVTVERLVSLWARQGIRVIFADFKGSDPELPGRVIAAHLDARPGAVCRVWPAQPVNMWQGTGVEVSNKLLGVQNFSEPFYQQAAETAVRLAVNVPGEPPARSSGEFLARLNLKYLERAYEGTPEAADVQALTVPQVMEGVRLRYAGFFAALGTRFDEGLSWGDADLTVLTIPTLAQPSDAMAAARIILTDFGAYCMQRKPRDERVVFIVDEFSAVTGAAPMVIDLAERVRDAAGMVVACVQSFEGLGRNQGERMRMLEALEPGGIIIHRTPNPAEVLKLAGTRHEPELSWHLDERGRTGDGGVRMNRVLSIDPDAIRRLRTGSAYVLTHGRSLEMSVIPTRISAGAAGRARELVGEARAAAADMAAAQEKWAAGQRARQAAAQQEVREAAAAQATADVQRTVRRETAQAAAAQQRPAKKRTARVKEPAGQQTLLDVQPEEV